MFGKVIRKVFRVVFKVVFREEYGEGVMAGFCVDKSEEGRQ